jgi:hypothetical protein
MLPSLRQAAESRHWRSTHCVFCANGVYLPREDRSHPGLPQGHEADGRVFRRKLRFAFGGRGKRGGGRAVYFLMVTDDMAAMLFAYAKNAQSDLTGKQRKQALRLMKEIRDG